MTNYALATLNAVLNTCALICVLFGYRAVKQKKLEEHKRWMLSAFSISLVFLVSYATRMLMFGDKHFTGQGGVRIFYFCVLISHVLLALLVAPLVLYTVFLGWKNRLVQHRQIAPKVLPVWVYVLGTGVLVYWLAFHYGA